MQLVRRLLDSCPHRRTGRRGMELRHVSWFLAALLFVALAATDGGDHMVLQAADISEQSVPVHAGIARWQGVDFPIYPDVGEATALGDGVSYRLPATNRKESDALGGKIAAFYAGKKFGTHAILSEIRQRTYRDYTSFANNVTTTTNRGAAVNINATANQVLVRLKPNSDPPLLAYPPGPFKADWDSLVNYRVPAWFRDAKFGIWAHWGPESVPEAGDWYGRNLYIQDHAQNKIHLQRYGHPSKFGFKDIINLWKAEKFDPEKLVDLYKSIGARYFVAQAVFHDNFDNWNSKYQPWNAVNMGPKKDIIGAWSAAARKAGLPFGVSVHARSAYTWYEVTRLSDTSGPMAGVPYDGVLTKADGKGLWWEGYDPDDLYAQYGHPISPYARDRKMQHDNPGDPPVPAFCEKLYHRMQDLIAQHHPDLLYFDDFKLPLYGVDQYYGLSIAAGLYNDSIAFNHGTNQAVMTGKNLEQFENRRLVNDLEAGRERDIRDLPWQCDVCIGNWFYKKGLKYRDAGQVVRGLIDVVSKNGNVLLSIPVKPDGTIDEAEQAIVENIGKWFAVNAEAIHGTRPWIAFGEGPSIQENEPDREKGGIFFFRRVPYTPCDFRFTARGDTLYAFAMAWPSDRRLVIRSLATNSKNLGGTITQVGLLGTREAVPYRQTAEGLEVTLPENPPCQYAVVLKISGLTWPVLHECQRP